MPFACTAHGLSDYNSKYAFFVTGSHSRRNTLKRFNDSTSSSRIVVIIIKRFLACTTLGSPCILWL